MRIIKSEFLSLYPNKIINIHPSLLPKFPGLNAGKQALDAGVSETGCTVHYVNYKLDSGKIILQKKVKIKRKETPKSLAKKILVQEHKLYPKAILKVFRL